MSTKSLKYLDLVPWRITLLYLKARHVLELPGGSLPEDLKEGEALSLEVFKLVVVAGKLRGKEFELSSGDNILAVTMSVMFTFLSTGFQSST